MNNKPLFKFHNIQYGWSNLTILYKNFYFSVNLSYVYNPLPDISLMVQALNRQIKYSFLVDQEGFDFELKILRYNKINNSVLISICNYYNFKRRYKNKNYKYSSHKNSKKQFIWVNRTYLINHLKKELNSFYILQDKAYKEDRKQQLDYILKNKDIKEQENLYEFYELIDNFYFNKKDLIFNNKNYHFSISKLSYKYPLQNSCYN